jgi:PAS domain S-box-containing protein
VYTNEKFEKMFGYEKGEMIGKNVSIVNAPTEKSPEEIKKMVMDVLEKQGEWHGEIENVKKDGTRFWCYANVSVFEYSTYGKVIVSVHTDITEKKKMELALKKSEEKWHRLFEILPVGVSIVTAGDCVMEFNDALGKILDISHEGLQRGDYRNRKYFRSDNTPMPPEEFPTNRAIAEGNIIQNVEIGIEKESGEKIWTMVSASPLPAKDSAVTVTYDITERKKMVEELEKRTQELQKTNELMVNRELKMVELKEELEKSKAA